MPNPKNKNRSLALNMVLLVVGMVMLTYASVPLYRIFCQVTGFGGTPQLAGKLPTTISDRVITVRFNADTDPELPWKFNTGQVSIPVQVGARMLTFYQAENLSKKAVTGHAAYNVVPNKAGIYFHKIDCFCFTNQTLQPGQKVDMPVSFYLDPALLDDPQMDDVRTITLSYTFFRAK